MKSILKILNNEKGVVAVIVGLLIVGFIGMLALVVDVGSMYEARRVDQTAADAAALAGAQELPDFPAEAKNKAQAYAQTYGNVTLPLEKIVISDNNHKIEVNPEITTPLFFSGITQKTISARAVAEVFSPLYLEGLVPFVVLKSALSFGSPTVLKSNTATKKENEKTPGQFQAMDYLDGDLWDDPNPPKGDGAKVYEYYIEHGYGGGICLNETEKVEPGNMAVPTGDGIKARIGTDTCTLGMVAEIRNGELYGKDLNCPRIVLVPFTDKFPENPSDKLTITGFYAFFITNVVVGKVKGQDQAEVTGQFIENLIITSSDDVTEYTDGIKVIRLIE